MNGIIKLLLQNSRLFNVKIASGLENVVEVIVEVVK